MTLARLVVHDNFLNMNLRRAQVRSQQERGTSVANGIDTKFASRFLRVGTVYASLQPAPSCPAGGIPERRHTDVIIDLDLRFHRPFVILGSAWTRPPFPSNRISRI